MINIWDKYPKRGTHFEAMQDKVKQHTWTYYTYYGRDRDDWSGPHTVKASTRDEALRKAQNEWMGTGQTVWNSKMKLVDNQ